MGRYGSCITNIHDPCATPFIFETHIMVDKICRKIFPGTATASLPDDETLSQEPPLADPPRDVLGL